ncbi:hypothetical protein REPUB_Repub08aG0087000 [Reevesia pubescens]
MKQCFWKIAQSTTERRFQDNLKKLGDLKPKAVEDLLRVPPQRWCMAFFKTDSRIDLVDNSICEAFNGTLLHARRKPIVSLFEDIRRKMMARIMKKIEENKKWIGKISPNNWKEIEKNYEVANRFSVRWNREREYKIDLGENRFKVNLDDKTCSCRRYTLSGIPCAYAICAIRDFRGNMEYYVSSWYNKEIYMLAYGNEIGTMEGRKDWPKTNIEESVLPLEFKNIPGRPEINKKKDPNEPKKQKKKVVNATF